MTTVKRPHPPEWRLEEAKAKFSQLVEQAMNGTPQHVSKRGKPAVVIVSAEEWEARTGQEPRPSAWDMFKNAPKLTDEEFEAFQRALERGEQTALYREVEFD